MIATEHQLSGLISMYKELADMYNAGDSKTAAQISNHVTRKNLIKSLAGLNIKKVLDAGGGTGQWALFLAELGYEVTLMDASRDMLDIAKESIKKKGFPIHIVEGNIESTDFKNETFDLIFAEGGVISLTPSPEHMMMELKRLVKSGGYLWIDYLNLVNWALMNPNVEVRSNLVNEEEEMVYMGKNEYPFRFFSPSKIRTLFYDTGFLTLNEFGNGIITNPLMDDNHFINTDLQQIMEAELAMSRTFSLTGKAFHIQLLAQKIIQ